MQTNSLIKRFLKGIFDRLNVESLTSRFDNLKIVTCKKMETLKR